VLSLFVLVDALGWEIVKDRRDFLADILPHRQELKTVFGFSSAAIPSILTGLLPREHGHWNLFVYDPKNSPFRWAHFLRRFPSSWINHRICRKLVKEISRRASGARGYFQIYGVPTELLPLFDVCEREDIYGPGGMRPSQSIFDLLEQNGIPYRVYSYHEYTDDRAVQQAVRDLRRKEARFFFVYLSEFDNFLHYHIHDKSSVEAELERYVSYLRALFQAAREVDPEARVYVFSDHGMTPIRRTYDLMRTIESLGWKAPEDYLALYDSTMARFWFYKEDARRGIIETLNRLECGHIVSAEEQHSFGIDFGHNRFGDLVFLMNEAWLMHPSHMGRVPWRGMHGFHPNDPTSAACLLASTPPPIPVARIWDMFHIMKHEAGMD
jgi:predicted AlkP superfamily pyrophosphatase or phosphodiesterase